MLPEEYFYNYQLLLHNNNTLCLKVELIIQKKILKGHLVNECKLSLMLKSLHNKWRDPRFKLTWVDS